ncbi:valine--tRNA ligase [Frankia sp. Cr2]|uniref:valine--tRNA ligase n=1 Tax=Frankia sp. Cr2 TaxID=3073932 RepID=UPI002AD4680A|nr:valine--tRNA ligase [Frankia sp. Cr2]
MESTEYDASTIESRVRDLWEQRDIYRFDPEADGTVFSVDTPPPYVSASHLHVGHAMSYSQPDFIVRYRRMRGERIFYPIGFDDNGLPTERFVEQKYKVRAVDMPRAEFVRLCLEETQKTAATYEDLWRRVGLSVDWSLRYSTIDERCQLTSQTSFVQLYRAGYVRRSSDPIIWCPDCRTALAQADVEDLERKGRIYQIAFTAASDDRPLVIATTRPELIPACVALYCHPDDERYRDLTSDAAVVPLFGYTVPIKTDPSVDPEFGTGLMMVCTFGDSEDVAKWRQDKLDLRLVIDPDGRLNALAGPLAGKSIEDARREVVKLLTEAGAVRESSSLRQVVGVHERCSTPVEFQIRPQWFVQVQEHRDRFRARAEELHWLPPFMKRRLDDWIDGLKWDWNISRQRHYGVPFPVWYCAACSEPLIPDVSDLPVDPLRDSPPADRCPACGHDVIEPERDVMDTWMTSSLTPQINDRWALRGLEPEPSLAPMSLRVQAFEIIRTWLFYTLVQSEFHFGRLPWDSVMISGWGLNEQGKKISKRDLEKSTTAEGFNRYVPDHVIEKYGADALRLWATSARLGQNLRYNEKDVRVGRKLAVKLFNVGRFIEQHMQDIDLDNAVHLSPPDRTALDRWLLSHLADTVAEATSAFEEFDFTAAYKAISRFFWSILCDRYIEMVKDRFFSMDRFSDADRVNALHTLREAFRSVVALFAPFAPFITEYLYQRYYQETEGLDSIHISAWPSVEPAWVSDRVEMDQMATMLDAVRVLRAQARLHSSTKIERLVLDARTPDAQRLAESVAESLRAAAHAVDLEFGVAEHASGVDDIFVSISV